MSAYPPLVEQAMAAYRHGRSLPVMMSQAASGTLYRGMVEGLVRGRLDRKQYESFCRIRDASRQAVEHGRAGRKVESAELFAAANQLAQAGDAGEEVQLLARSWLEQAQAFFSARAGSFAAATASIQEALTVDGLLEKKYGYTLFHVQRVHLLHLLVRIKGESGVAREAIELAEAATEYAEGEEPQLPIGSDWGKGKIDQVPLIFRHAMRMRLAGEAGLILGFADRARALELFTAFPAWERCENSPDLIEIYQWGQTKQAFLEKDVEAFLGGASTFLEAGRRDTGGWYAVALDLMDYLAEICPEAAAELSREIQADLEEWRRLPIEIMAPRCLRLVIRAVEKKP